MQYSSVHGNLPTPLIGVQGVLSTAPWSIEVLGVDLSGGPPGADRESISDGKVKADKRHSKSRRTQLKLNELFIPVALDLTFLMRSAIPRTSKV